MNVAGFVTVVLVLGVMCLIGCHAFMSKSSTLDSGLLLFRFWGQEVDLLDCFVLSLRFGPPFVPYFSEISQLQFCLMAKFVPVDSVPVNGFEEQAFSPYCSDIYDDFGDPNIFPKVGEQYQAEIPPLMSESDCSLFQKKPHNAERTCTFNESQLGLPIRIIWIKDEVEDNKHSPLKHACESIGFTKTSEFSKIECILNSPGHDKLNPEPEDIDITLVNGTKLGASGNCSVQQETKIGVHENKCKGHCLVPGSSTDTWNEIEEASFTLGLYIFGKNLVKVQRFIGNKTMGDIMAFYYGKFYKSERYQRWSELRKMKSRKCIHGQKNFTAPRQQELLSCLLPNVPEECRSKLLEVSKTFVEGKMRLEDYVLTLKASVGLNTLVEAVRVGTEKDLTGLTADSVKSTQALSVRPEKPVGKDCSRLTPAEIINILTGNFRLSKARSGDLFWEAVWPRLLARCRHSEKLGSDDNYVVAFKHPLIFLVLGVNKFSRELEKGDDYFDSICDVVGKVASDPELIELETNADDDCTTKEGNG
ncbi:uncharacterized protein LOC133312977 [Gastrolobium bilobum]|uniref:uncharacterized protein LOC133312977 n=1 Tax=Gastrolobium bilobum TaxID=150636 RepID=UPI002AAF8E83|nr:uncharacterized protein LOC133312977 [Gastrolobium bilobum]